MLQAAADRGKGRYPMKVKVQNLNSVLWTAVLTAFLYLCYFPGLARGIVPFLVLFIISEYKNLRLDRFHGWIVLYGIYLGFLSVSLYKSILAGTSLGEIIRFLLILILIPLTCVIFDGNFEQKWKIFKLLVFLKAVSILAIWIIVFIRQDARVYREWAYSLGAGDIYIQDSISIFGRFFGMPRVQLRGNTLFVMAFVIDLLREHRLNLVSITFFLAGIAAGNQAYILGFAVFLAYKIWLLMTDMIKKRKWLFFAIFFIVAWGALLCFIPYAHRVWEAKAGYSNVVRLNQVRAFAGADPVFGEGLGSAVSAEGLASARYFELQTLYIYYQIGMAGLLLFYVLTFWPYFAKRENNKIAAYAVYLVYTFWNPYCFDSTHIIALLLISNALGKGKAGAGRKWKDGKRNCDALLSRKTE